MEDSATPIPPSLWTSLNSWFTSTVFFVLLNLMIATIVFTSNLPNNTKLQQQEEDEQKQNHQPTQIARSPSVLHRLKSFNFYPQKPQPESSPYTHYHHQHQQPPPLEVAATQYVFDQPLQYQHFDFDPTNPDQFDFNPTRQDNIRADTGFDFDPTRQDMRMRRDEKFDFDSTRQEIRREKQFDFDPTRNEMYTETGFGYDPTRKDMQTGTGFDFDTADEEREHADEFQSLDEVYSKLKTGGHDRSKSESGIPAKAPVKMKKSVSLKVGFAHLEEEEIVEARRPATVRERKSAVKVVDDDDVEVDSRADDFINKFKNDLKLQRIESIIRTKEASNRGGGR